MIEKAVGFVTGQPWKVAAIASAVLNAGLAVALALSMSATKVERAQKETAIATLKAEREAVKAASAMARAKAQAAARATESRQANIAIGVAKDVQARLDGIRSGVDGLRRAAATQGHAGRNDLPVAPAGPADSAGTPADDRVLVSPEVLGECQYNTEIALGWQRWYREVFIQTPPNGE